MNKKYLMIFFIFSFIITVLVLIPLRTTINVFTAHMDVPPPGTVVIPISSQPETAKDNLQLNTFPFITTTPTPTPIPTKPPVQSGKPIQITNPLIGGPGGPNYCIDDEDPDGCDDNSSFLVPKGIGGVQGTCGTVIEQAHKLVNSLPQAIKALRDNLNPAVTNCGYSSGAYASGYLSTYFVIDAYNLAGFKELSKTNPNNVSPTGLLNWWKTQPSGYTFIPYQTTTMQQYASGQQDLTGCVMFINLPSGGIHVGIVNLLEVYTNNGDGVISILQSDTRYFLDRFIVSGWAIQNTPQHQTVINGIAGFGCHQ